MHHSSLTRLLLLGLACTACRSTDPALYMSDGRKLREVPPLSYRIGVAPVDAQGLLTGTEREDDRYFFDLEEDAIQQLFVTVLRQQRVGNGVVALSGERALADSRGQADLVLRPRLGEAPRFTYREKGDRAWVAGALWFTTWYFGLKVEDRVYDARVAFDFDLVNPYDGAVLDTFTIENNLMDTSLWERSGRLKDKGMMGDERAEVEKTFVSNSGVGQSLVLPPFWTKDDRDVTSRVLSVKVCARIAARVAGYLKQDFLSRERELLGQLRLIRPRNRENMREILSFEARLLAREPITGCAVYVRGRREPVVDLVAEDALPVRAQQRRGNLYQVTLKVPEERGIKLPRRGWNRVVIEFEIAGQTTSRSLIFFNVGPE